MGESDEREREECITKHKHTPASIVIASGTTARPKNSSRKHSLEDKEKEMTVVAPTMKHLIAALLVASALALTATRAQELQGALAGGICEKDPELKEISASNPAVATCCTKFDTLLANIDAVLAQGVTALVPVMDCTTLPPWELSANCYNSLLSAGANCYYEMNVMIEFFNETGILETATTAVKTGDADEDTLKSLPTEDEFKQEAIDWIPTGREKLQAITGSPDINPICCQAITKLVDDKCACEETPMTAVNKRLDKIGMNVQDWLDLAKQVVKGMGCDGADNLQAYPECTA